MTHAWKNFKRWSWVAAMMLMVSQTGYAQLNSLNAFGRQYFDTSVGNYANQSTNQFTISGASYDLKYIGKNIIPAAFEMPIASQNCGVKGFSISQTTTLGQYGFNNIQLYDFSTMASFDPISNTPVSTQLTSSAAFTVAYLNPPKAGPVVSINNVIFDSKRFSPKTRALIFINTVNNNLTTSDKYVMTAQGMAPSSGFQRSFTQVAMHEIGHMYGLDHPKTGQPTGIMDPFIANQMGRDNVRNLGYPSSFELGGINANFATVLGGCP